jgi:hypothetical protein
MTSVEHELTEDLAALQRLPEDDPAPGSMDPICATTGVTFARPAPPVGSEPDPAEPDMEEPDMEEPAGNR